MDATSLMLSMLFSTFGLGFVVYARKAGKMVPAIAGAILMVVPYFIANNVLLTVICLGLTALPFIFRDL
jgi:hypothetical protein